MRRLIPACTACLVSLLHFGAIRANGPAASLPAAPAVDAPLPASDAGCDGDRESLFSLDVLLGMQTGVRAQAALVRRSDWELAGEAYYGLLLTKLGASEGGGLGGRVIWRRSSAGGCDSMLFGPGFDFLDEFKRNGAWMAAPSVDVSWLHGFGDRGGWETGLNVGVGVGLSGERGSGRTAAGEVTPIISVYTGLRY